MFPYQSSCEDDTTLVDAEGECEAMLATRKTAHVGPLLVVIAATQRSCQCRGSSVRR